MVAIFEWIEPGKKKHDGLQGCEKAMSKTRVSYEMKGEMVVGLYNVKCASSGCVQKGRAVLALRQYSVIKRS